MHGYIVLAPLTEETTKEILVGHIPTGHDIGKEQLAESCDQARSLYIFGIYAAKGRAATCATSTLLYELHRVTELYKLSYIFAKPGTPEGRNLMNRFKFEKVEGSFIEVLTAARLLSYWPYEKKKISRFAIKLD